MSANICNKAEEEQEEVSSLVSCQGKIAAIILCYVCKLYIFVSDLTSADKSLREQLLYFI